MKKVNCIKVILSLCLVMSCITNIIVYAMGIYAVEADQYQYITISRSSATLKRGEGILVTATTYPLTGDAYAYWYSSNPSVASVNNGYIVGHSAGTATITAQYRGDIAESGVTEVTCSVTVTSTPIFENGIYFIQNATTGTYLDIKGSYTTEGSQIHLWELTGNHSRKWELYLIGTGYYTIQSYHPSSGMFIGIEMDSTETSSATVHQYEICTGYHTQWSFMLTDSGNYAMIPRSGEERMFALRASSSSTSNGVVTHQRKYTNNSNYQDEWELTRMLPLSGSEIVYNSTGDWSNSTIKALTNCYSYAINTHTYAIRNIDGSNVYLPLDPGVVSRKSIVGFYDDPSIIISATKNDFDSMSDTLNRVLSIEIVEAYEQCPVGSYKIALFVDPISSSSDEIYDYHWLRQDADGLWSHKRGTGDVTRVDDTGELIIDPRNADLFYGYQDFNGTTGYLNYEFVCFLSITPWNNLATLSSTASINIYPLQNPLDIIGIDSNGSIISYMGIEDYQEIQIIAEMYTENNELVRVDYQNLQTLPEITTGGESD